MVAQGEIEDAIAQRNEAREQRDFERADEIRNQLTERGIGLKDGPQGTSWEVLRGVSLGEDAGARERSSGVGDQEPVRALLRPTWTLPRSPLPSLPRRR